MGGFRVFGFGIMVFSVYTTSTTTTTTAHAPVAAAAAAAALVITFVQMTVDTCGTVLLLSTRLLVSL